MLKNLKAVLLTSRMQSLYWRTGMMILAVLVNQAIVMIDQVGFNPQTVVFAGLVLGEISKAIANKLNNK